MEPINYFSQACADYFNLQPSAVKGRANSATEYHRRYLYNLIYSVFEFDLPKDWALNYFRFWLFHFGSLAAIYTKEFGWIPSPYGVEKINHQYQPAVINVTNPFLKGSKTGVVGINCEIIRLLDDYYGLDDLVTEYAQKLAQVDKAININLMNCNVSKAFPAKSKKDAEDVKEAYGRATEGEPLILINKDVLNGDDKRLVNLFGDVKSDYIVGDLLQAKRTIINEFLTKIGIKNANYDKRERLNADEVNQNNDETSSIVSVMLENLQACFEKLNAISGLNCSVKLRFDYNVEEVDNNA